MPAAADVAPGKWSKIQVLFDDGTYSIIAGEYEGNHALGERWNGGKDGIGFPSQAGNPLWHVVPGFLARAVLHGILDELSSKKETGPEQVASIFEELKSWR